MSHEIYNDDTAAFNARPAWHGLGVVLPDGDLSIDSVRVHAPRFLFDIETRPLIIGEKQTGVGQDGDIIDWIEPTDRLAPQHVAQVAADDGTVLSITGSKYHVYDNAKLLDLASQVSAFGDGTTLESVLTLRNRRTAVVLAHAGQFELPGNDVSHNYYLFTTTHDATGALEVRPTSIRVVCNNTLSLAVGQSTAKMRVKHTSNMEAMVESGVAAMRLGSAQFNRFEERAKSMAARPLSGQEVKQFFLDVYQGHNGAIPANPKTSGDVARRNRALETVSSWLANLDDPKQRMQGSTTMWSAFNAVTQWADHDSRVRRSGGETAKSARQHSALFGHADKLKQVALNRALATV